MKRTITLALAALVAVAGRAQAQEPKTFFDYLESAYVVGRLNAAPPLKYRDETLLVYTTKVLDILHAQVGKPQTLMVVVELPAKGDAPPIKPDTPFVAPVVLLPEHAYWRDNLPNTPRHQIVGGTRYIFTGDQVTEAEKIARPFAATLERKKAERWPDQSVAIAAALSSSVNVLREDAARYLATHPVLFANMGDTARGQLLAYLESDAPLDLRGRVVGAMADSHEEQMTPLLEELVRRDDPIGAAALRALERVGKPREASTLYELEKAKSAPVRAYALEALGARAAEDKRAFDTVTAVLASDEPVEVRAAAARGLGRSGDRDAIPALTAALGRGDESAKPAAAAIAALGGPEAVSVLKKAIEEGNGDAKIAAVIAFVDLRGDCPGCTEFLEQQHASNPDKGVRDMIGIMLELHKKHEHGS